MERINDVAGQLCTTKEEIEQAFVEYFEALFKSSKQTNVDRSVRAIQGKISEEMKAHLEAPFGEAEIF